MAHSSQEQLTTSQISLLIDHLRQLSKSGKPVGLRNRFTCTSFDALGELAFAESFGCLKEGELHRWIKLIHHAVNSMGHIFNFKHFTLMLFDFMMFLLTMFGSQVVKRQQEQLDRCAKKTGERLNRDADLPDFMTYILRAKKADPNAMTEDEIMSNSQVPISVSSETTAATFARLSFNLMKAPEVYNKSVDGIRSTFYNEGDITLRSTQKLEYLNASIQKGLRVYPDICTSSAARRSDCRRKVCR